MTTDTVGGVWQYSIDLASGLQEHGIQVMLAVLGPVPMPDQQAVADELDVEVLLTNLPLDWTAKSGAEVEQTGRTLSSLADHVNAEIVHLNSPALASSASFSVPVVGVCHSCVSTWWQTLRTNTLPPEFIWQSDLTRRGYRAADILLAPTFAFADATAQFYHLPEVPLVVRNGRRACRKETSTTLAPFAFTAGRLWDEGKNIAAIDRAASRTQVPVLAAGSSRGPNGAYADFRHLQVLGRLTDLEMKRHLDARPVFISAARYEPFGLAVLEAAQSGCALVLSDIPSFRELWDDVAVFVDPDDDVSLALTLDALMHTPKWRCTLGEKAQARAATYSVDAMTAGVMAAYRSLPGPKSLRSSREEAIA
jgi:glycosyltransferase involved in cell wall biosynthesis